MQGRITALKRQQRRRDRVSVYLDGAFAFGLQEIIAARLSIGQDLDAQQVGELLRLEAGERAYERCLHYLSFRPRSTREVRDYMRGKDVDEDIREQVIERLTRTRLLDDRAFCAYWIDNRRAHRPKGRWALRSELALKGIEREIIAEMLEELDEEADALRAAERQAVKLARYDDATFRRRLLGFLQRRGFGYDVARRTVEYYEKDRASEQSDVGPDIAGYGPDHE